MQWVSAAEHSAPVRVPMPEPVHLVTVLPSMYGPQVPWTAGLFQPGPAWPGLAATLHHQAAPAERRVRGEERHLPGCAEPA